MSKKGPSEDGSFWLLFHVAGKRKAGGCMVIVRQSIYNPEKDVMAVNNGSILSRYTGGYGAAVDIGTTTIAASLFSLADKKYCGNITETNSQIKFGTDVMMRIMNAAMGKAALLHGLVVNQIEDMLLRSCRGICDKSQIVKMAVAGNTTMCHLFLGKDVSGMAGAPFKMAYSGSVDIKGREIGFKEFPDMDIYVLPGVAAHIGADAVSVLCNQKLYNKEKIQLAADIGTNAEIILNNKGKIYACSAAAGPAFEGKGVKCGIRAGKGAINSIKISKSTGNIVLGVIGSLIPEGICGSGLVDAIAEFLKAGILRPDGYLMDCGEALQNKVHKDIAERLCKSAEGNYFVLYNKQHEIVVTQKDIRNIQLAKAAIQAAAEVLLETAGISLNDVDEVKIAGVFGKFIHPKSAVLFGLYPDIDNGNIEFVGNAAGNGAAQALLDSSYRELALRYSKEARHIELAGKEIFQDKFLNAMELKKW